MTTLMKTLFVSLVFVFLAKTSCAQPFLPGTPPPIITPIANPYSGSWIYYTTDSISGLAFLGGVNTNSATNLINQIVTGSTNSYVATFVGFATNVDLVSNISFGPFVSLIYDTNSVGIHAAGVTAAKGEYAQIANGVWTNLSGNGSAVVFMNPTYFLQTNNISLYSTASLLPNSVWLDVIGTTAVPTNSGFGYRFNFGGLYVTNLNAGGLVGIVPMLSIDTTKVLTNNQTAPATFDGAGAFTNQFGGRLTILGASVQEGTGTASPNNGAHAEGQTTAATGTGSHAEGDFSTADGQFSHAEGAFTMAHGNYTHAEGLNALATNDNSHVGSDGTTIGSLTNKTWNGYYGNGYFFRGGRMNGDGGGLTNIQLGNASVAFATNAAAGGNIATTNYFPFRTFYVSPTGNNATAEAGDSSKPYAANFSSTLGNVMTLATNVGDVVFLLPYTNYQAVMINITNGVTFRGYNKQTTIIYQTNTFGGQGSQASFFQPGNNVTLSDFTYFSQSNYNSFVFSAPNLVTANFTNLMMDRLTLHGGFDLFYSFNQVGYASGTIQNSYLDSIWDFVQFNGSQPSFGNLTSINNEFHALNQAGMSRLFASPKFTMQDFGSRFYNFGITNPVGANLWAGSFTPHGSRFINTFTNNLPIQENVINVSGDYIDQDHNISYSLMPDGASYYLGYLYLTNTYNLTNFTLTAAGTAAVNQFYKLKTAVGDINNSQGNTNTFAIWTNAVNNAEVRLNDPDVLLASGGAAPSWSVTNAADNLLYYNSDLINPVPKTDAGWSVQDGAGPAPTWNFFTNSAQAFFPQIFGGIVQETTNGNVNVNSSIISTNFIGNGAGLTNIPSGAIQALPRIPNAVTLTGSVFTFSNSTPNYLECYFSGSVAYSVSKNGAAVFGSLASDGYLILQPTNKVAITYTVAPTLFTNTF